MAFGGKNSGMDPDDQAFLSQIEQNIRGKDNEQEVAKREAEQRAREMERIRKASSNVSIQKSDRQPAPARPAQPASNPLESDPRYREYYARLKKQKGEPVGEASPVPASGGQATPARGNQSKTVGPGAIVRFDDQSIGIYKDAVSGRDYALFYFLQPDGQFAPEGVFLQEYQARVIGNLPENYFSQLRDSATWNRDVIVFHLSDFECVKFLDEIRDHEDREPRGGIPARTASVTPAPASHSSDARPESPQPSQPEPAPRPSPSPTPAAGTPGNEGLVQGRRFHIRFGGKMWEAVFWLSDEQGAIVAHSTHGDWSLMRLDLDRFKDSLELGEMVDDATRTAISNAVAASA